MEQDWRNTSITGMYRDEDAARLLAEYKTLLLDGESLSALRHVG